MREHVAFILWALHGGPLDYSLAARYDWAGRAQALTAQRLTGGDPAEQATKTIVQQVEVLFAEMNKLHSHVMASPDRTLSPAEIFSRVDWLTQTIEGLQERQANLTDYSRLTPDKREIMIQAALIQEELDSY